MTPIAGLVTVHATSTVAVTARTLKDTECTCPATQGKQNLLGQPLFLLLHTDWFWDCGFLTLET